MNDKDVKRQCQNKLVGSKQTELPKTIIKTRRNCQEMDIPRYNDKMTKTVEKLTTAIVRKPKLKNKRRHISAARQKKYDRALRDSISPPSDADSLGKKHNINWYWLETVIPVMFMAMMSKIRYL